MEKMDGWHIDTIKYLGRGWRWAALSTCKLKSGYFYSFLSTFHGWLCEWWSERIVQVFQDDWPRNIFLDF